MTCQRNNKNEGAKKRSHKMSFGLICVQ
jgi:hypothetical protein